MRLRKRKYSAAQRWAVYFVHGAKCYWGGEPINLQNMEIDHIIPQSLLKDPQKKAEVFKRYNLPDEFNIDSYENWMPCCRKCNLEKSNRTFECTPAIQGIIEDARSKADEARKAELQLLSDTQIAKMLNDLERTYAIHASDVFASFIAKKIVALNPLPQDEISFNSGPVTLRMPANKSGVVAKKVSTYGAGGEHHTVTACSSVGEFDIMIGESCTIIGFSFTLAKGSTFELENTQLRFLQALFENGSIQTNLLAVASVFPHQGFISPTSDPQTRKLHTWTMGTRISIGLFSYSISLRVSASFALDIEYYDFTFGDKGGHIERSRWQRQVLLADQRSDADAKVIEHDQPESELKPARR
jgi:hypothetical protein